MKRQSKIVRPSLSYNMENILKVRSNPVDAVFSPVKAGVYEELGIYL